MYNNALSCAVSSSRNPAVWAAVTTTRHSSHSTQHSAPSSTQLSRTAWRSPLQRMVTRASISSTASSFLARVRVVDDRHRLVRLDRRILLLLEKVAGNLVEEIANVLPSLGGGLEHVGIVLPRKLLNGTLGDRPRSPFLFNLVHLCAHNVNVTVLLVRDELVDPKLDLLPARRIRKVMTDNGGPRRAVVDPTHPFVSLCSGCIPDAQGY